MYGCNSGHDCGGVDAKISLLIVVVSRYFLSGGMLEKSRTGARILATSMCTAVRHPCPHFIMRASFYGNPEMHTADMLFRKHLEPVPHVSSTLVHIPIHTDVAGSA